MLRHLRTAHMHPAPEVVSTGGWIAQRILLMAAAVVFIAPFVVAYVE